MNRSVFLVVLALLAGAALTIGLRQHRALEELRTASNAPLAASSDRTSSAAPADIPSAGAYHPSEELLRLRAEVSRLREELDAPPGRAKSIARAAEDWSLAHPGPRPSEQPGFVHFTNLAPAGFTTPAAAFASYLHAMRNQDREPLTATRMKDFWDLPDDYDDPAAKYSIHIGPGIGGENGFRVLRESAIAPDRVRLTIEMENSDGSPALQERILVRREGHWRLVPEKLMRAPDDPPSR